VHQPELVIRLLEHRQSPLRERAELRPLASGVDLEPESPPHDSGEQCGPRVAARLGTTRSLAEQRFRIGQASGPEQRIGQIELQREILR
jgi:hypothetical protein